MNYHYPLSSKKYENKKIQQDVIHFIKSAVDIDFVYASIIGE